MSTPDGVDFRADGTIRITIDGQNYTVRRPKWGEFKAARESLYAMQEAAQELIAEVKDDTAPAHESAGEAANRQTREMRELSQSLMERTDDITGSWVERTLNEPLVEGRTSLIDKQLPARDDWPSFMVTTEFIASLQEHWRSVPLARSATPKRAR